MNRTSASHLVTMGVSTNKTEEFQDLGDRNLGPHLLKINARHAEQLGSREEEPVRCNFRTRKQAAVRPPKPDRQRSLQQFNADIDPQILRRTLIMEGKHSNRLFVFLQPVDHESS